MKRITTKVIAMTAMLVYAAGAAMAFPLAYAINFSGQFGVIDLATGAFTPVGRAWRTRRTASEERRAVHSIP